MSSKGIMRRARRLYFASLLALIIPAVFAQSPPARNRDDLDVTMHVIVDPDAKVPDEIVRRITLPKPAQPANGGSSTGTTESGKPSESGAKGQKPDSAAGAQGREFGQQVSEDAKQRAEEAKNNKKPKPENPPGKPPDKPPGKPPDKPPGKPPDKPPGKPPDKPPGKPPSPPGRPPTPGG